LRIDEPAAPMMVLWLSATNLISKMPLESSRILPTLTAYPLPVSRIDEAVKALAVLCSKYLHKHLALYHSQLHAARIGLAISPTAQTSLTILQQDRFALRLWLNDLLEHSPPWLGIKKADYWKWRLLPKTCCKLGVK